MKLNPLLLKDFYKTGHAFQYPKGTEIVYSNLTPRSSRMPGVKGVVVFGIQGFVLDLYFRFKEEFFDRDKKDVIKEYKRRMDTALGPDTVQVDHIEKLHDLQYLPLKICALPEGTVCPLRVPLLTIENTHPDFYWLTNFVETWLSCALWHPITAATIAFEYRKLFEEYAKMTSDMPEFVQWQGHDFSMRGHTSVESAIVSGAAHLLSFTGTDTIPAIDYLESSYAANSERELIGGSVPATEHSVMCLGGKESEIETFERLITDVYPKGIVSIVSDTWDYWKVIGETLPSLKEKILARDGKVVIRPDSGDPVEIVCGNPSAPDGSLEHKGTIEALWDIFGGTINSKGYKQLNSHIGCIYGDSITLARAEQICGKLLGKGFASTNMVFGIGSYTYQYLTRDTFGFAVKATYGEINGQPVEIFKDPKTDDGTKKSAKGLLRVNSDLTLSESVTREEESQGMLERVFMNGVLCRIQSLSQIRARLMEQL